MKKIKRTKYDAQSPIVKACKLDVMSVWNKKRQPSVSEELSQILTSDRAELASVK